MTLPVVIEPQHIDWHSSENHLLLNPRLPVRDGERVQKAWAKWGSRVEGHIGLLTSGSTSGSGRLILLSKAALTTSAVAVNHHLHANAKDVWLKTLPDFHVGGLGIFIRAVLSGARVENAMGELGSWKPQKFFELVEKTHATLVSLVPSQVFDLVALKLRAPRTLRAIVVGGGALNHELFKAATKLGWPVLPSYGLTECCSQVATASIDEWKQRFEIAKHHDEFETLPMYALSHVQVMSDKDAPLKLKSASLLTARITLDDHDGIFEDPKQDGWFQTEDHIQTNTVSGRTTLQIEGRGGDFIKIGGESVSLAALETKLQALRITQNYHSDVALIASPDARLGHVIHLLAAPAPSNERQRLVDAFANEVLPIERIRKVVEVARIPRSALGKLLQLEAQKLAQS